MKRYFGEMTKRMKKYREDVLDITRWVCTERAIFTTEVYKNNEAQPLAIKRALMLEKILGNMSIYIEDETLLAGNQASSNCAAPIFPEYAMDWVVNELDLFEKRDGDVFHITEDNKQILRELEPYWKGKTIKEKALASMPELSRLFYDYGIIKAEGNITSGDAHIAVMYEKVLSQGLKGYEDRVAEKINNLDLTDYKNQEKLHFYKGIMITIDAVKNFAIRYSELAEATSKEAGTEDRKKELRELARILKKVPYNPAETFYEAVQSVWLIQLVLQIESNGHSLSYGRMDQYLYPYYEKDLSEGIINEEFACELLTNLWIKTYTINKIRSWSHTQYSAGSPLYQNVTIGGQTLEGKDAVNPLSYMIIRSVAQAHLPQPNLTIRYFSGLDERFMNEAIELMKLGTGMPAFNSDEVIIKSLIDKGVSKEDAYNYSAIGCVEVAVPGKWGYRCTGMSFLNYPKTLLIAMNDGADPKTGVKLMEGAGKFVDYTSYGDLEKAWEKTISEFTKQQVIIDAAVDRCLEKNTMDVLCSALTDDCIERGLSLKEGGAVYDMISDLQVGIANLADSLSAIKKCVFEDELITPEALWHAIMHDFEGEEGRKIQKILQDVPPKFGNDDDYVDHLIRDAYVTHIKEIKKYKNTRYGRGPIGGNYYGGTSSISANVGQGNGTMATPDGRNATEPLAEGCAPCHLMDKNGPTAVFKSVSKLPTMDITGGVLLNQKINPQLLSSEADKTKLISLLRTFFNRLDGFHVQYNVVSKETLLDAQIHPDDHRDLIVRIAGYSAFFNVLSKKTQDDIIGRTEQTL
ncbi:MAG: formate C-acetyltransferase/glycerol dehydratase family glycyl radical enzyme [Firmicutes bacterium HGW-Firmicutes-5]|nr:MAG: formate C-acetyltransferase/glycerol dehydratase family glycyl radical enzyme [Firmicutes bacterium HGW-Firmicutes-5]